jgi:competence protein CoiA
MKFADIEGNVRAEAQPGLAGKCRDCGQLVVAKCGQLRMWHWAHWKSKACDPWWETETEWHRSWKNQFPVAWQEIGHTAQSGDRHRADVRTQCGLVLEFQYSALSEAERISREELYTRLVWVVHAHRRLRDRKKFFASLCGPLRVASGLPTFTIHRADSALLRDWGKSRVPVYFDFGEAEQGDIPLWRLYPSGSDALAYVTPVVRAEFVKAHREGVNLEEMFDQVFARDRKIASARAPSRVPLPGFSRYPIGRMRRL